MSDSQHRAKRPRHRARLAAAGALAVTAALAWWRVGLFDLPAVPSGVTLANSGLADLPALRRLDLYIHGTSTRSADLLDNRAPNELRGAAGLVRSGIDLIDRGNAGQGLELMRQGIRKQPRNLVLGNAYRMATFRLRRAYLNDARGRGELAPQFPPHLDKQPIAFFTQLDASQPSRETKLQLALAWVDKMLLFPALEIKAPASVEAVDLLTSVIEGGNPGYVPALFARGLNHLHRPARLVWPESAKTAPDAAAVDIGRCVAIGRALGAGSDRLQALLAIALGDAYVKAGRYGVARSWWQIAQNLCRDEDVQQLVRRRYAWRDEDILDRLEDELDRSRSALEQPMTDLRVMWD